ncbi:MAG: hypothetical protein LWW98_08375 [Deltaproteobacteria bacterium]|nr:hypothetical protein [Deltaproteobacteria bacterium]
MKKKTCKFSTIICLSLFLLCLTISAHASDTSQALVAEGRVLLFNNGNPTYSGILLANAKFEGAVTADSSDQEANLFYAVTRILAFGLEQGSGTGLETLRDLFEAFGISRNDVELVEVDAPFNEPPEIYDHYDPPEIIPGGEDVRAFLAGPFLTLLDAAIANLNVITNTFNISLLSSETDDDYNLEVDYGDVLLFRSALYTLKSAILIVTAYDLNIDLRELAVLGNAGVLQIQRDIPDKYQDVLKLRGTNGANGAASLINAKSALLAGINAYETAFIFITTESDPQENDLFYFESDEDQREAEFFLTQLTEIENSLNENRPAEFTTIEERWIFTDTTTNDQLEIEIEKDANEKFVIGDYWGQNGCDFISCNGWVEVFSVSGTSVTIEMAYDGMYSGSATFTGTITDGTSISGTFTEYDDFGAVKGSGFFTATRQSRESETETINFNLIFGNTNKSPLDIRAILPEFDQNSEPVPASFGEPILNGILPDIATNDALTRKMDLQPSGEFLIPNANINVQDGNINDWVAITPVFVDITEEDEYEFPGDDITALYLAKDTENLYVRMRLTENPNTLSPDANGGSMHYFVQLARSGSASAWSDRYFGVKYDSGNWRVMVHKNAGYEVLGDHPTGFAQAVGNELEWKVPLNELELPFTGCYLNTWSHWTPGSYDCSDDNDTRLRVGPLSSISGTIERPAGVGNIFIYACDASTGRRVGKIHITSPGTYTIESLPVGANVYIFAIWDADNNGIKTFGDYFGTTGPIVVAIGGTTGADFAINTWINDSFIMTKPGLYRLFGSDTYNIPDPQHYYGPWDPNEVDWGSGWTFIGESNKTETFNTGQYYKNILIIWDKEPMFNFDAFEDLTAETAFATNADGTSCEYNWISSGLKNFNAYDWSEPCYFKGHPDGLYARTEDWYGFSLLTMPDDSIGNVARQLKITLVSNLLGDLNGDNDVGLADAILALRVVSNFSNAIELNFNSDVNGNGRIGLEEAIYALQHAAGLRTCVTKDIEDYVHIEGHVYKAGTTIPVQGAVVSTSLDLQTAVTDANGHFFLQTNTLTGYSSTPYTITILASGYLTYSETHTWGDHPINQVFYVNY